MSFLLSILSIAVMLVVFYVRGSRKKTQLAAATWDQLLAKLEAVPIDGITRVARDYLEPRKGQLAIETDEMWFLIGEDEGLRRMRSNADVLIALAAFAAQWNFEESVVVGERMRRDGLDLRRAAFHIELGLLSGIEKVKGPLYVQEAASAYYLMRERILALYQTSHAGRYPRLVASL